MAYLRERWFGIVLKAVREYYPDARLVAWGPLVEGETATDAPATFSPQSVPAAARLELAILDPPEPDQSHIVEIRRALAASDLPMESDLRLMSDLTTMEREEVLQRGVQFGG